MNELPCIVCDIELESALPDTLDVTNQPYGGTTFTTGGHYGSTIFDPISRSKHLEVNICDDCLRTAAANLKVLKANAVYKAKQWTYKPWDPSEES